MTTDDALDQMRSVIRAVGGLVAPVAPVVPGIVSGVLAGIDLIQAIAQSGRDPKVEITRLVEAYKQLKKADDTVDAARRAKFPHG